MSSTGAAFALIAAVVAVTTPATVTAASGLETPRRAMETPHRPRARRLQDTSTCTGVTAGCATDDSCNDDGEVDSTCPDPTSYVCEAQLPGLNACESPPLDSMLPCWMSDLEGTLALNEISIPATHNTMAKGISACFQDGQTDLIHTQVGEGSCRERQMMLGNALSGALLLLMHSEIEGGGACSFVACLSRLIVDHASPSRRSIVSTPNGGTSIAGAGGETVIRSCVEVSAV